MRMGERRIISDQSAVGPASPSVGSGSLPWRRWSQGLFGGLALLVLCFTVYVPGIFTIPPIDRDECRFAQASRQMFEAAALPPDALNPAFHDGGWAIPKVQDRPRLNKPPLIYWLQVASAWTFTAGDPLRDHIWMYRLPSVLGATIAVLLTWRMGRRMFDPRAAWLAAALLAICPLVVFDAHQARADQLLLATVVATQFFLWRAWDRAERTPHAERDPHAERSMTRAGAAPPPHSLAIAAGFWFSLALSILAKGPIGPMIAALTILALGVTTRRWVWIGSLRPFTLGPIIVGALVLPWLWMVAQRVGWSNYAAMVFGETLGRTIKSNEGHWGPPGMHTLLLAVLFWPGSLMTALAIKAAIIRATRPRDGVDRDRSSVSARDASLQTNDAPAASIADHHVDPPNARAGFLSRARAWWRSRRPAHRIPAGRDRAELFLLAWLLPSWLVFELVGAKLLHYTMPMYPAVALLTARFTLAMSPARALRELKNIDRVGFGAWLVIGAVANLALLGITLYLLARSFDSAVTHTFRISPLHAVMAGTACLVALVWLMTVAPMLRARMLRRSLLLASFAAAVMWITFLLVPAPFILPGSGTHEITAALDRAGLLDREIATEYHEDSIVFATRGRALRLSRDEIERWLNEGERRVGVLRNGVQGHIPTTGANTDLRDRREIVHVPGRGYWLIVQSRPKPDKPMMIHNDTDSPPPAPETSR